MKLCPCVQAYVDEMKETHGGWAHSGHPSIEIRYETDLKRPVKIRRYSASQGAYIEFRTRTVKTLYVAAKFCALCGKRLK